MRKARRARAIDAVRGPQHARMTFARGWSKFDTVRFRPSVDVIVTFDLRSAGRRSGSPSSRPSTVAR
jgi:hypothetical protein